MTKTITILVLSLFFCHINAQENADSKLLDPVLQQLKLSKKDIHKPLYREKALPNKPANTVIVIPKYRVNETDSEGHLYLELDAYVIIADSKSGKILYTYKEEYAWTSDAVVLSDIVIDTGLYQLNENSRAFGIRVSYEGSSRPNPYYATDLSLFTVQNKRLTKILKNYQIDRSGGEWDTTCNGEFEDSKGNIAIDKNKTNGFNNLIVRSTTKYTKSFSANGECAEKTSTKNSTKYLKYNGEEYK